MAVTQGIGDRKDRHHRAGWEQAPETEGPVSTLTRSA